MLSNVFNIPLTCSFWDTLAKLYLKKYTDNNFKLSEVLFLLPNRRACQALTNAFVRAQGLIPTILPQIYPIAELDDDEVFFSSFNKLSSLTYNDTPISREERLFLFIRLIMSKPTDFGLKNISLAQAANLAADLANLIDTAYNQNLSFDKLENLVPEKYATHWQETLKLLKIITEYWPQILEERQSIDVCDLKNKILCQQAFVWAENKTEQNIVVAGVTANFPSIVNLIKCILNLPNGEIYFAGIDFNADSEYWDAIDETHPQFELKSLLELLEIDRKEINNISDFSDFKRELFISEIMRPAKTSDKWRLAHHKLSIDDIRDHFSIVECNTQRDEALAIAIQMRAVLDFPEKTAALITYDRNLARRVAAELSRFNIKVDDSAGIPLHLCPIGIFFSLIVEAANDIESETKLITLLKHPFMLYNLSASQFRKKVYQYEFMLRKRNNHADAEDLLNFINQIKSILIDFGTLIKNPNIPFKDIIEKHIKIAELFATSDSMLGSSMIWRGDAGKIAAKFFTKLLNSSDVLGVIDGKDYLALLRELMGQESVRTNYGTHPRLSILGPIEAHLHHFDYVILGEVNEGIWPKPIKSDMWMSRPMKHDFGFSQPEKAIGILGFGLSGFLSSDNVVITRAERIDGAPMKKSRWLLRTETVLNAIGNGQDIDILRLNGLSKLANTLDMPSDFVPISAPTPCPPVSSRPRKLSASGVNLLVNDPYAAYAKYILRLFPLDDLDRKLQSFDFGNLVHAVLEEFNNKHSSVFPENAQEIMMELGNKYFEDLNIPSDTKSFWMPKFRKMIEWVCLQEKAYRPHVQKVHNEVKGEYVINASKGKFTFTAKADRVDELKNGNISIIDYKTGSSLPSEKEIVSGHALQLPIEGVIASCGSFENVKNAPVEELNYWQLASKSVNILDDDTPLVDKCESFLNKLVHTYDLPDTCYYSRPNPKFVSKNTDYDHLARIKEWSIQDSGDDNDN